MALKKTEKSAAKRSDYGILVKPVVTEKSSLVGAAGNKIVFRVHPDATKDEVRTAVERVFKVNVEAVNTVNYMGKMKRTMRSRGRRDSFKKAYVTLREGQTIDLVEGI